ncbi:DsbA family protein [Granulicella aggregans]|uniref:DsbA family protein n=1 Tax=Granulicella aggregans TaxID=474949 RepID=UPI0021DF9AAB|nr:DsbA family protein [Granulicella aggregans]
MSIVGKPYFSLSFLIALAAAGCHAQPPAKASVDGSISPELSRRVEVMIRTRLDVPANYEFHIESLSKSDIPGYDTLTVDFSTEGKSSRPIPFLLSKDGKTLAQFSKFDISKDLRTSVSGVDRPARGGAADAPVLIVGFDDLECPFCARMNAQLFPAILDRYKDQVRIVYRDFPLDQHPWALRAAVDTNCVGAQSGTGYWNLVDYIHAHADEIGGTEKTVAKANEMLDKLATEEGKKQKIDEAALSACLAKQDTTGIKASMKDAEALGVSATPALFINGEKIEGAQPLEYVYRMIDGALVAAGKTPPPAPVTSAAPAAKQGN